MASLSDLSKQLVDMVSVDTQKRVISGEARPKPKIHTVQKPTVSGPPVRPDVLPTTSGRTHGWVPTGVNQWNYINPQGRVATDVKGPGMGPAMNPAARIVTGPGQGVRARDFGSLSDEELAQAMVYGARLQDPFRATYKPTPQSLQQGWADSGSPFVAKAGAVGPSENISDAPKSIPIEGYPGASIARFLSRDLNGDGQLDFNDVAATAASYAVAGPLAKGALAITPAPVKKAAAKAGMKVADKALGVGKYPISPALRKQARAESIQAKKAIPGKAAGAVKKGARKAAERAVGMGTHPISPALREQLLKEMALKRGGIAAGVGVPAAYLAWLLSNYADEANQ